MKTISKTILLGVALFGFTVANASALKLEGRWFLHQFGELRTYHGDFLNVCSGENFRQCRTVQYGFNGEETDAFFGNTRLSIARVMVPRNGTDSTKPFGEADNQKPSYTIEIFVRGMTDQHPSPIVLSIDGEVFQLGAQDWNLGSPEGYNVSETFSITDPKLNQQLIDAMKAGDRLRIIYNGWKLTQFQLRGITNALNALDTHIAEITTE
tara:strand:+ start:752 stop:1381 length:630 start_codon:yes stop_codon:yes gene_type:complete